MACNLYFLYLIIWFYLVANRKSGFCSGLESAGEFPPMPWTESDHGAAKGVCVMFIDVV